MNPGSPGTNGHRRSLRRVQLGERLDAWRRLLVRCGRKPTRKRVHALRVVTLRVLAELEHRIEEQGKGPESLAAARWIKLGEKLRQALSPVRETDVWLDKLTALRQSLGDTNGYSPRSNKACIRQIDELQEMLGAKRRQGEKELVAEIESRRERLEESSRQVEAAQSRSVGVAGPPLGDAGGPQIGEQFARVVKEFPLLDAGNLHEFRKSIKKVRYMAEIFAVRDAEAGRLVSSIRKMQSAIGEWHDWQDLAKESHAHRKRGDLTELLETLAVESLEKALAVCERATTNLLWRNNGVHDFSHPPEKKPVRGAELVDASVVSRSA
jgi:CHAD domain-containing protein